MRRWAYLAVSVAVGFACDVVFDMRGFGFASPETTGLFVAIAVCWIVGVFLFGFARRISNTKSAEAGSLGLVRGIARSGVCLFTVAGAWIFAARILPNSAVVYFKLHRAYIESHWQKDHAEFQITSDIGISYFPLAFQNVDQRGTFVIPSVFYLWDKYYQLPVNPIERVTELTRCGGDIYLVNRVEGQVYVVRHYANPSGSLPTPCLVNPIPKGHLRG